MWICPKCGENLEDVFDSCWNCAGKQQQVDSPKPTQKLRWFHYVFAGIVSYLIPVLAVAIQSASVLSSGIRLYQAILYQEMSNPLFWIWMAVPAGITFLILFPFLDLPGFRRVLLIVFCIIWLGLAFAASSGVPRELVSFADFGVVFSMR